MNKISELNTKPTLKIERRVVLLGLLVTACGGGGTMSSGGTGKIVEGATIVDGHIEGVAEANKYRAMHGFSPLQPNDRLKHAAQIHASQMAYAGIMDHDIDGFGAMSTFESRVKTLGVALPASENVAYGYRNVARATKSWYESPGHRKNMLTPNYRQCGVAGARHPNNGDTIYWAGVYSV